MRKNLGCRAYGFETFCVNGCCDYAALLKCDAREKKLVRKTHKRK